MMHVYFDDEKLVWNVNVNHQHDVRTLNFKVGTLTHVPKSGLRHLGNSDTLQKR